MRGKQVTPLAELRQLSDTPRVGPVKRESLRLIGEAGILRLRSGAILESTNSSGNSGRIARLIPETQTIFNPEISAGHQVRKEAYRGKGNLKIGIKMVTSRGINDGSFTHREIPLPEH